MDIRLKQYEIAFKLDYQKIEKLKAENECLKKEIEELKNRIVRLMNLS